MNSFLLTVSGVLFLLNYGLCNPIPTFIIDVLRNNVICDNNVTLFVPPLNKTLDVTAAECFQNQLETIESNCTVKTPSTLFHARSVLKKIMDRKAAECKFEDNETVSYLSFLDKFKELIQRYNSEQN